MKILITGATGMVGTRLLEKLFLQGFDNVRILTRNKSKAAETIPFPVEVYEWNPQNDYLEKNALEGVDCIIHLAGESVASGRWTEEKKSEILNSRTQGTSLLAKTIQQMTIRPTKFISASAIGVYGDRNDELLNSSSLEGDSFLADVCKQWEKPVLELKKINVGVQILRIGIVLSSQGGALTQMLTPFKMGVAGALGNGKQFMSWIHVDDLVQMIIFLTEHKSNQTIFNAVSPNPVTNSSFTKTLGKLLKRPTFLAVPKMALKTIFGEMSQILLASQKVQPDGISELGFKFKFPDLEGALNDILQSTILGENILVRYQWVDKKIDHVFNFFSDEKNLEKITPPYLNFEITKKTDANLRKGTLLDYSLKLHGIPLTWKTEITDFTPMEKFTDEQISGPYSKWIHKHSFYAVKNGTLIVDEITYKIPMGVLGKVAAGSLIAKDLEAIFSYRKKVISKIL